MNLGVLDRRSLPAERQWHGMKGEKSKRHRPKPAPPLLWQNPNLACYPQKTRGQGNPDCHGGGNLPQGEYPPSVPAQPAKAANPAPSKRLTQASWQHSGHQPRIDPLLTHPAWHPLSFVYSPWTCLEVGERTGNRHQVIRYENPAAKPGPCTGLTAT